MASFKNLLVAVAVLAIHAASAFGITSLKTVNLLHNDTNSPFFTKAADGTGDDFLIYSNGGGTFTPVGAPRPGESTSITTHGVFSIVGN